MSPNQASPRSVEAEIARANTEATRIRAEAGKAIVATIFRGVIPLGIFGVAIGATAVIVQCAAPDLHLAGLLIVWICATLVSLLSVISGVLEAQRLGWNRTRGERPMQLEVNEANRLLHSIQE
jgi:hypothetical protein